MRTLVLSSILALSALAGPALRPASATLRPVVSWGAAAVQACQQVSSGPCTISTITKRSLSGDVSEYSFTLKIGSGANDVIGLHRVVKDAGILPPPNIAPAFFVHGDVLGFDGAFVASAASASVPDSHSLPVFLAERGIDVWGIDLRWALVPASTTDFTFMQGWGLAMQASDVGIGLAVAQGARGSSQPMNLLGWSRGGQVGYAYLSFEAALPPAQRRVGGFIPVDIYARTDDPTLRGYACTRQAARETEIGLGHYADGTGAFAAGLGTLAVSNPNDPSPNIPNLTNAQAALLVGAATFVILQPTEPTPGYHWTGGTFDANGLPNGLSFTSQSYFFDFLKGASPFEPNKLILDAEAMMCEEDDTPFLDNLADVTVPVLYVSADGGFGTFGNYSLTLLGSSDVETLNVDLLPPAARVLDFGHADLVLAGDADTLAWSPIYDWMTGIRQQ